MPPNQFAQVMSCTPGVLRINSVCDDGMLKINEVERIVTNRVAELAAETASKPSRTARSAENRNTASATLIIVNAVRRLLRRALLRIRPANFIATSEPPARPACPSRGAAGATRVPRHADRG